MPRCRPRSSAARIRCSARCSVEPGRGVFPLAIETAEAFARARIALVGEAAHVVPPIGAQGLNLGLRDGATIAEIVADARVKASMSARLTCWRATIDSAAPMSTQPHHCRRSC